MGWGKIRKSITKPFKDLGHGWWNDVRGPVVGVVGGALTGGALGAAGLVGGVGALSGTATGAIGGGLLGGYAGLQVDQASQMRKAQKEADARAAKEADNPVLAPETALGTNMLNVDQEAEGDVTARRRRRTSVSQSTSRGLTRVLGGGSQLN